MVGAEAQKPYDRPPLSKNYLAGDWDEERVALRKPEALEELNLTWKLGMAATALTLEENKLSITVKFINLAVMTRQHTDHRMPLFA